MKHSSITYGILFIVTIVAFFIGQQFPLIGHSFAAIVLGMLAVNSPLSVYIEQKIIKKVSSLLLKIGIVLLGFTLSFDQLSQTAFRAFPIILLVITAAFLTVHFLGQRLNLSGKRRTLVAAGTAICGGSAIAAIAPVIDAEDDDITFALSTIFIFNLLALIIFPILASIFNLSELQYGVFAGTAINDTSSVVAAGYQYSQFAGDTATIVKLLRTLMIVPVSMLASQQRYRQAKQSNQSYSLTRIFPIFILFFIATIGMANIFNLPGAFTDGMKTLSRLCITIALAAVGMSVNFKQLRQAGLNTIKVGGIAWSMVILISLILTQILFV